MATIKSHKLSSLNNINVLFHSFERKSKIKVLAGLVPPRVMEIICSMPLAQLSGILRHSLFGLSMVFFLAYMAFPPHICVSKFSVFF